MKPDQWAALKALQRAGREKPAETNGYVDRARQMRGQQPRFTDQRRSRKPARKDREKAR